MPDYASLIDRVRSGSGADRELDADLGRLFGAEPKRKNIYRRNRYPLQLMRVEEKFPPYTSSLDAVVRLVEEKLPGWGGNVDFGIYVNGAVLRRDKETWVRGVSHEPARAILAALLTALQAQEAS